MRFSNRLTECLKSYNYSDMLQMKYAITLLFFLVPRILCADTYKDSVFELKIKEPNSYKGFEGVYASIVTFLKEAQEGADVSTLSIGRINYPIPKDLKKSVSAQSQYQKELESQLKSAGKKEITFQKVETGKIGKLDYISFPHSYKQEDGKVISSVWMLVNVDQTSSLNIRFFSKQSEFEGNWEDVKVALKTLEVARVK